MKTMRKICEVGDRDYVINIRDYFKNKVFYQKNEAVTFLRCIKF